MAKIPQRLAPRAEFEDDTSYVVYLWKAKVAAYQAACERQRRIDIWTGIGLLAFSALASYGFYHFILDIIS
jgi:peptidoglycan/LPS O-acetylase OafA/YrhL